MTQFVPDGEAVGEGAEELYNGIEENRFVEEDRPSQETDADSPVGEDLGLKAAGKTGGCGCGGGRGGCGCGGGGHGHGGHGHGEAGGAGHRGGGCGCGGRGHGGHGHGPHGGDAQAASADEEGDPAPTGAEPTQKSPEQLLGERTEDLQRLQAEYVNYKRRVDRDRDLARARGIEDVVTDLLPVLDGVAAAREMEGELSGGLKLLADELDKLAGKYGLTSYGRPGEQFDPQVHDALMQVPGEAGQNEPLVAQVLQPGWMLKDRIVRHARVSVSEPTQ